MGTTPATGILTQQRVAEYHSDMDMPGMPGMSMNMYLFHRDWHRQNRDPQPPQQPDAAWGSDIDYGQHFLQMHHEMVKAGDSEQKFFMHHQSIVSWFASKNYELPPEWNPTSPIPDILGYVPDLSVYTPEILQAVQSWAQQEGKTVEEFLTRSTDNPRFELSAYFTRNGVPSGEAGEPYTGARKLADFRNVNQLGCCIVFPHNEWHGAIGGAMSTTWTAIADPIFYFGVHWHIDKVFDDFKKLQAEQTLHSGNVGLLAELRAVPTKDRALPRKFTPEQLQRRQRDIENSARLNPLQP